jgi:hypothetical protein
MSQEKLQAFAEAVSKSEEPKKAIQIDSGGSRQNDR